MDARPGCGGAYCPGERMSVFCKVPLIIGVVECPSYAVGPVKIQHHAMSLQLHR
jgi:hypothetical protein